jgi:hypothetical protein
MTGRQKIKYKPRKVTSLDASWRDRTSFHKAGMIFLWDWHSRVRNPNDACCCVVFTNKVFL